MEKDIMKRCVTGQARGQATMFPDLPQKLNKTLRRPRGGDRATQPGTALHASETWMSAIPSERGPVAACY